jgi:Sugar (and other) transporter
MITPVIINRLQWKAYLIFMCTNLAFIPLVYFCYPETANLTLEEIDYLFTNPEKSAVKLSRELHRDRKRGVRRESFFQTCAGRRSSSAATFAAPSSLEKKQRESGAFEQYEKVRGRRVLRIVCL